MKPEEAISGGPLGTHVRNVTVSSNIDGHIDEEIKTLKETLEKIHGGSHHSRGVEKMQALR
jgi:hypothetical protein